MGKGSVRRPPQISEKELEDNWAKTFGKPPEPTPRPPRKRCPDAWKDRSVSSY